MKITPTGVDWDVVPPSPPVNVEETVTVNVKVPAMLIDCSESLAWVGLTKENGQDPPPTAVHPQLNAKLLVEYGGIDTWPSDVQRGTRTLGSHDLLESSTTDWPSVMDCVFAPTTTATIGEVATVTRNDAEADCELDRRLNLPTKPDTETVASTKYVCPGVSAPGCTMILLEFAPATAAPSEPVISTPD